ncbi:hypothetical protein [Pantoea sp. BAV 3049]|uniref:hypothetical protein n=1 Tax=Pantoea sp. BAV 3049 TaxID=2654188 RepID=UPI00131D0D9A|nr:hypothetical protein [Pantoea sp. BAV 3049]
MARPRKNPVEVPGQEKASSTPAAEPDTTSPETSSADTLAQPVAEQDTTSTPAAAEQQPDFDMSAAGAEEILSHFLQYGFTDQQGHALENCADFLQLVELATNPVVIVQQPGPEENAVQASATVAASPAVNTARAGGPVLTEHGWLVK